MSYPYIGIQSGLLGVYHNPQISFTIDNAIKADGSVKLIGFTIPVLLMPTMPFNAFSVGVPIGFNYTHFAVSDITLITNGKSSSRSIKSETQNNNFAVVAGLDFRIKTSSYVDITISALGDYYIMDAVKSDDDTTTNYYSVTGRVGVLFRTY